MAKRLGTVLVFREGISEEEVRVALEMINDTLDQEYFIEMGSRQPGGVPVPYHLNEFEDHDGSGPVWYIP